MPLRTAKIYTTDNMKRWQGRGVTGAPSWWVERMLVETIRQFLKKLNKLSAYTSTKAFFDNAFFDKY